MVLKIVDAQLFTFVRERHDKDTRSHANDDLVQEETNLHIRKFFFTNRVTQAWNSLPSDVKEATSINAFKNKYDSHINNYLTYL